MNDELNESRRRLLNDVLREDPGGLENDKEAALFVAAATVGVLVIQPDAAKEVPLGISANVQPSERSDMPTLTDEELIALFPSNSCFLAEVEGRQILVFLDPKVEETAVHKGSVRLPSP